MGNSNSSRKPTSKRSRPGRILNTKRSQITSEPGESYRTDSHVQSFHFPKNSDDLDRMQFMHFLMNHVWGSKFSSPIDQLLKSGNGRVLDVGCGPAAWSLELATIYPSTQFVGIDIAKAFPSEIKPTNLEFLRHDVNNGIPYADNSFDFVRMSMMASCFKDNQWDALLRELVRVLKPGGYIELMESDMTYYHVGPRFSRLNSHLNSFITSTGANVYITQRLESLLSSTMSTSTSTTSSRSSSFTTNCSNSPHNLSTSAYDLHPLSTLTTLNPSFNHSSISLTNVKSDYRSITVGKLGGKSGVIYEDLLNMYFSNTVVDILPRYMEISKEEYLRFWRCCREEFAQHKASTKVYRFWAQKTIQD